MEDENLLYESQKRALELAIQHAQVADEIAGKAFERLSIAYQLIETERLTAASYLAAAGVEDEQLFYELGLPFFIEDMGNDDT
jgi:hypothetical protein